MSEEILLSLLEKLNQSNDFQDVSAAWEKASSQFLADPLADFWRAVNVYFDKAMVARLQCCVEDGENLRVRDKVSAAIFTRFQVIKPYQGAVRLLLRRMGLKVVVSGRAILWNTADAIWHWVGATDTDFNYYTKRGLLFVILGITHVYWLQQTPSDAQLQAFIDRSIDRVMGITRIKSMIKKGMQRFS